jgi:hypothetical protein
MATRESLPYGLLGEKGSFQSFRRGAMKLEAAAIWRVLNGETGLMPVALESMLRQLLASNATQWNAEDTVRDATSHRAAADAKRTIDSLNLQRVSIIHDINVYCFNALNPNSSAPLVTEAPGAICDRLSILHLRIEHACRRLSGDQASSVANIITEARVLCEAFDVMLCDVIEGRRRFAFFVPMKLYGHATPDAD